MKKILFILVLILAVFLTACGSTTDSNKVSDDNSKLVDDSVKNSGDATNLAEEITDPLRREKTCPTIINLAGKTTVCKTGCDYSTIGEAITNSDSVVVTDCAVYDESLIIDRKTVDLDCNLAVIKGEGSKDIIQVKNSDGVKISNCKLTQGKIALSLLVAKNGEFKNNQIFNNAQGMRVKLSSNNLFENNIVDSNSDDGASFITASTNNIIKNNQFKNNEGTGIVMLASPNTIENNLFEKNTRGGFELQGKDSTLKSNTFKENSVYGLSCTLVSNAVFESNTCTNNELACQGCPFDSCTQTSC